MPQNGVSDLVVIIESHSLGSSSGLASRVSSRVELEEIEKLLQYPVVLYQILDSKTW